MRILVADDNADNLEMLSRRLRRKGHEIVTARDGREAIERLRDRHPDVVLMDVSMPVLSGHDATREIRADPSLRDVPVIALTAHASMADREQALAAGCDAFATKPFEFPVLLDLIDTVVAEARHD